MKNITDLLPLICLLPLFFLYVRAAQKFRHTINDTQKQTSVYLLVLYTAAMALPGFTLGSVRVPLLVCYLLLYLISCLPVIIGREKEAGRWLFSNLQFLFFTAPHLIVIGLLALYLQTDVAGILHNTHLRLLALIFVTLLDTTILYYLLYRFERKSGLRSLHWTSEESVLFSRFVWFCSFSVFFDSAACFFPLPTIFSLLFLIGSNILLILMAVLFAHHVYIITHDSYLKEEYMCLQEEAMILHSRTVQLEKTAYIDTLTQIYTRKYALLNMESMLKNGESFAVAFIDLDNLKQINDQRGHLAGDEYLKNFSMRMKEHLRSNDIFVRYGGDEFLILMPDLTADTSNERLKDIQSEASASPPKGWDIPFSFGLATAQSNQGKSAEDWIAIADSAMYEDKMQRKIQKEGR